MTNCVVLLYLSQVTQQPGPCGRFAEAGQLVHVPGVSHQEHRRPGSNHRAEPCSEQREELAEAWRAEEEINYARQGKHGSSDDLICRRLSRLPCSAGSFRLGVAVSKQARARYCAHSFLHLRVTQFPISWFDVATLCHQPNRHPTTRTGSSDLRISVSVRRLMTLPLLIKKKTEPCLKRACVLQQVFFSYCKSFQIIKCINYWFMVCLLLFFFFTWKHYY